MQTTKVQCQTPGGPFLRVCLLFCVCACVCVRVCFCGHVSFHQRMALMWAVRCIEAEEATGSSSMFAIQHAFKLDIQLPPCGCQYDAGVSGVIVHFAFIILLLCTTSA